MPDLQIYEAASVGLLEAVVERMNLGDNIDKATQYGHTALINASLNNHVEVVKLLLSAGCKVNLMDVNRESALIVAAANGNRDIVILLIAHGADITHRNGQGKTAKEMAKRNNHLLTYQFLVEAERSEMQDEYISKHKLTESPKVPRAASRPATPNATKQFSRVKSFGGMFDDKKKAQATGDAVNIREELNKIRYSTKESERNAPRPRSGTAEKLEAMEAPVKPRPVWEEGTGSGRAPEIGAGLINKHLMLRPSKGDLIGRGLMFGSSESLARRTETEEDHKAKRQSLESRLQNRLSERPKQDELKLKGILKRQAESDTSDDVKGLLSRKLDRRPTPQELVDRNIMKDANVSPLLVATEEMLKKRQLELALEQRLERRHRYNEVLRQSILLKNQQDVERQREEEKKQKKQCRGSLLSHITSKMGRRTGSCTSLSNYDGSPPQTKSSKLSFNGEVLVARTYDADDYDRSPATKRKYTPTERLGIAKELNQFKMYEMQVHDESKDHIHFIRTPNGL